jgi:jumonji domain-containing protein 2
MFLTPQLLIAEGIPFNTVKQCPGDYVVTFPGAFHIVVNAGTNVAEAVNFAFRNWFKRSLYLRRKRKNFEHPGSF